MPLPCEGDGIFFFQKEDSKCKKEYKNINKGVLHV